MSKRSSSASEDSNGSSTEPHANTGSEIRPQLECSRLELEIKNAVKGTSGWENLKQIMLKVANVVALNGVHTKIHKIWNLNQIDVASNQYDF